MFLCEKERITWFFSLQIFNSRTETCVYVSSAVMEGRSRKNTSHSTGSCNILQNVPWKSFQEG